MNISIKQKQLKTLVECKGDTANINEIIANLARSKAKIEGKTSFKPLLKILKALADKQRLLILELLLERGEMCICEFGFALDLSQPTISHHIPKLEDVELIEGIKSGKFIHYKIKKRAAEELFDLLNRIFRSS